MSGTSAETYAVKKVQPDEKVLEIARAAVPDMDERAKAAAASLSDSPMEAMQRMQSLIDDVKYGLGYIVAISDLGIIPTLIGFLSGEFDLATAAAHLLYRLGRWPPNGEVMVKAGALPYLVAMYKAHPEFNIVMGGPAAGAMKRIAMHGVELQAAVVKAGGIEALVTGFRKQRMADDVEDTIPINAERIRIMKGVSEYEAELENA